MGDKKVKLGQFFTKGNLWLRPHIATFIRDTNCTIAYDPFAGNGDLLKISEQYGIHETIGLDIDETLRWKVNDSLLGIPHYDNAVVITNPPYLSNYSASRKKIYESVAVYFENSEYDDLYLIALSKTLETQSFVVAIVPETFINSNFKQKNRLSSVTILENSPFEDTDTPVCVLCFDEKEKSYDEISVYKNDAYIGKLSTFESLRLQPTNAVDIRFNVKEAWLGLRAVDTTNPLNKIHFDFKGKFDYNWEDGIKVSSRLLSTIQINIPTGDRCKFIEECNAILAEIREETQDVILSPFKGNMKNGVRRRRLDFKTARAIMEKAYFRLYGGKKMEANTDYFQYALAHKEALMDPDYHFLVDKSVIPLTKEEENKLTLANKNVIDYLTAIDVLVKQLGRLWIAKRCCISSS